MAFDDTNTFTIGGIKCQELMRKERFAQLETRAIRKFRCLWPQRHALISALNPSGMSVGGVVVYQGIPYPGLTGLYPQTFDVEGDGPLSHAAGPNGGVMEYEYAIITAEFRGYRGFDALGYVDIQYGVNVITLGHAAQLLETVNSDGNDPIPVSSYAHQGLPLVVLNICRGRAGVNGFPVEKIMNACLNPLNEKPFLGFEPGTVMFNGGRAMRQTATNTGTGIETSQNGNAVNTTVLWTGMWQIDLQFICRPKLPHDYLARWKPGVGFDGFAKARFQNGKGDFMGRSDLELIFKNPDANAANI